MTYTFVGNKDYIDEEISKIRKNFSLENIVTYNLEEDLINKVIEDLRIGRDRVLRECWRKID